MRLFQGFIRERYLPSGDKLKRPCSGFLKKSRKGMVPLELFGAPTVLGAASSVAAKAMAPDRSKLIKTIEAFFKIFSPWIVGRLTLVVEPKTKLRLKSIISNRMRFF